MLTAETIYKVETAEGVNMLSIPIPIDLRVLGFTWFWDLGLTIIMLFILPATLLVVNGLGLLET